MIFDKLKAVRAQIEDAAQRSGRSPDAVDLVAVTKKASADAVTELLRSNFVGHIGENRVQDAAKKREALKQVPDLPSVPWRLIGHLQTNKAKAAIQTFDAIDSLDSLKLAMELDSCLEAVGKTLPVLVQVKLSERESQYGVSPEAVEEFLAQCRGLRRLDIRGLMAIAPMLDPVEAVRPHFKRLKTIFDRSFAGKEGGVLSMGMSRDFAIAVEEGSTMVRVGTVLFA
ncbi:MAG: YggS family pyridoxal phosphate-dependent enzyme [Elusimicrobia bacterium]|nr:YggS family pyridoxal phosphate-dependent enzyme [Elusimicrobiota bacterium]